MTPSVCESCGRTPAQKFKIRRHIGLLLMMKMVQIEPTLCRDCAIRTLKRYTGRTLVQGWWGLISFFVVNPATILLNLWNLTKAYRMDRPHLSSPPETETATRVLARAPTRSRNQPVTVAGTA